MITRRAILKYSALAGASRSGRAFAEDNDVSSLSVSDPKGRLNLIRRIIPKTGEELPIIGLGTSSSFRKLAANNGVKQLEAVISALVNKGGAVFDTAPSYGESERVAGKIVQQLGDNHRVFWATKLNVVPRGGSTAVVEEARAQVERSFGYRGKEVIDLIQVHNLRDIPTQMGILKELKQEGRVRYIGTTYTSYKGFSNLAEIMQQEPIDFIGVNYAVDDRDAAQKIFPIAQERGIAVLVYLPFGRTRLWQRVAGHEIPEWAAEIGIESWAQFFIKYVAAHPTVTVVTPATSKPHHVLDNLAAGVGDLPDTALQKRMAEHIDALPSG